MKVKNLHEIFRYFFRILATFLSMIDQMNFLKEENKIKNTINQILLENQSYFSKQSEKQEFIFPKNSLAGKSYK